MKKRISYWFLILILPFSGCDALLQLAETLPDTIPQDPTQTEIVGGLKEALVQGTSFAVNTLSKEGGYLNDVKVRIPFPPEAQKVANTMRDLGLGKLVDEFETKLNEGAEKGAKLAFPIFKSAITGMTFQDAKGILLGQQDAATQYFQTRTETQLYNAFSPKIKTSLDQVKATEIWYEITSRYNKLPLVKKVETDIVKYATNKALDGLFLKVSDEEAKIRSTIASRKTDLLKKVFDFADRQRQK
ncbi:MAG: DUF4197 domain-containing protein [Bacteroidota bacterium]